MPLAVSAATISYVQGNYATPQTPQSSVSVTFTAAQTAGDLNVVVVGWNDTTAAVKTVTDKSGNTYTLGVGPTLVNGSLSQSIYYAKNSRAAAAGANIVTVTFSVAAKSPDIRILEYSGADPNNPVDVAAAGNGNSASSSSGSATTTNPTDLLFGATYVITTTAGPGSGFTQRLLTMPDGDIAEDRMVTAIGSYSATALLSSSGAWIAQMIAFRTASGVTLPPTVSSVSPNTGPTAGGTAVTITGTNFAAGATVTFGGVAATNVVVTSGTQINATTPAGSAGAVAVTVTVNGQNASLTGGFTYVVSAGTISYVQGDYATPQTPQSSVSVTFTAAQTAGDLNVVVVGWNDTTAAVKTVTDQSGNTYTLGVGPTLVNGSLSQSIYYAKNIGSAAAGANIVSVTFSVAAKSPDIRILEYSGADPNNPADVTTAGSGNSGNSSSGSATTTNPTDLLFAATYVITTTAGPGSGFTQRLLTTPDGDIAEDQMVTAAGSYSATAPLSSSGAWIAQMVAFRTPSGVTPPPTMSSVSPNSGPTSGGTAVTITGTNFAAGATVTFGGVAATNVVVTSGTQINATTPTGSAGAVAVTVTVSGQSASLTSGFTYVVIPTVSGVSPSSGSTAGGTAVTITGTNFAAGAMVTFGGVAATNVVVTSGTQINATTPAGSAGAVAVTVNGQNASLTGGFTYVVSAGTISYVQGNDATPQTPQTSVSVAFSAAQTAGDLNVVVVGWNDTTAVVKTVTDQSGNTYTLGVGPTLVSGSLSQSIYYARNIGSAAAGANIVSVTFSVAAKSPDIRILEYSGADPNSPADVAAAGSGNSASGSSGSATTTNPTDLLFAANYVITTTTGQGSGFTQRLLTTPDGDIAEDQMVTAAGSYSATAPLSSSGAWIMQMVAFRTPSGGTLPLTVSGVSPNTGSTTGGTAVTITGTNLAAGATVTFGGAAATNVVVASGTQITATTPAGSAGAVTVTVTMNGQSASLTNGFSYAPGDPPNLISISVTPANPTIPNGLSQQFTATGNYSDGSTQNLTASVVWSSSDESIATITTGGLATAVGAGTSTIEAASGSVNGSTTLTVTSSAVVPGLVQHVSGSSTRDNNDFSSPYCYYLWLPGFTTAGNAVVVGFTFQRNTSPTVTDDKNDNYAIVADYFDSVDSQSVAIAAALNVAPGARKISVCFAGDPGGFVQPMATEFDNVIGVDLSSAGAHGTGTSLTAGSITPSANGDLTYQIAYSLATNQNQSSFTAGSQANINWSLLSADLMDGLAAQYGVYNSTSAINPTMTMGTTGTWISAAVLLKTGSAGSIPSGMRIVHLDHENIPTHTSSGGSGNSFPNPTILELPCSGNLEVAQMAGGNPPNFITGMTDSNGNRWEQAGSTVENGDQDVQTFYAASANCSSTLSVNVQWNETDGDQTILFYDVAGAAASPLDTTGSAAGMQTATGNLTAFSITPSTSSTEIIFAMMPVDYNTVTGLVNGLNDADTFSGESVSGPEPVDENNGWGHFVVSSTNAVPVTWTFLSNSLAAETWTSMASAFK
jgi:hypothetical protein